MKKIGIITLNGYFNYGNRFQNYASEQVLRSLGFEVQTIIDTTNVTCNNQSISTFSRIREIGFDKFCKKIKSKISYHINKKEIEKMKKEKIEAFKKFTLKYINETDYSISIEEIPENLADQFDFFVAGSDQVWNPTYDDTSSVNFLTFAPKEKRIAYAPSFGVSEIPKEYVDEYKVWLSEMSKLSVREEAGAEIIKELTGRDAAVLVDPTMMLTKEDWLSISKEAANKPNGKYLLTYILGSLSKERRKRIEVIAKKNNLEIVNLGDINDPKRFVADPSEFLDYVNSSSLIYTDSFHGTVFSILFETPFIVFNRQGNSLSMFSRINTLLNKFNLESRFEGNIKDNIEIFEVDFSHCYPVLEDERNKTYKYLKDALNVSI